MTDERTYTLEEAAAQIARDECATYGHVWSVVEFTGTDVIEVVCTRCDVVPKFARVEELTRAIRDHEKAITIIGEVRLADDGSTARAEAKHAADKVLWEHGRGD